MARQRGPAVEGESRGDLAHRVEHVEDGTTCTLFPAECADADLMTNWITAKDGSFVSLAEMR